MPCLSLSCSSSSSSDTTTTQNLPKPFLDPFASLLRDSVDRFIADHRNAVSDFSSFTSIFSRLIHTLPDPPFELLWFYSAAIFHSTRPSPAPRGRVSAVKNIFQLLIACSSLAGAAERIAALAPVLCELCSLEKPQLAGEEARSLLEGLVSFISLCCAEIRDDRSLSSSFSGVVRAWVVDRQGDRDELEVFFPMSGGNVLARMRMVESCGVGYLAGVVMVEAFMLRLCLRFGAEVSRAELERDVRSCAVQMIACDFRCFSFLDTLLKTLLEPVLPVSNLLNSKDASFLREVLYDSVLMADYSFFRPQLGTLIQSEHLKNLAVTWLLIADNAIRLIRKCDDQSKVISYMKAFSDSCLVSHLIKWVTNQIGMHRKILPNVSTPVALIKWMLLVEEEGVIVFDCAMCKVRAKRVFCDSRVEYVLPLPHPLPIAQPGGETLDSADLEMIDSEDALAIDGQKKRKGTMLGTDIKVKFVKYQVHDNSAQEKFPYLGCPVSDHDVVEMQQ